MQTGSFVGASAFQVGNAGRASDTIAGVYSDTSNDALLRLNASRTWDLQAHNSSDSGHFSITDSTSGNERLVIDSTGNVGIGTTTPGTMVSGHAETLSVYGKGIATNDGNVQMYMGGFDANTYGILGTYNNVPLTFRANSTEAMRILTNGNVGIGPTTPWGKLHVNGTASAAAGSAPTGIFQISALRV